jgi:ATP-dependent 26S proteasome regulatory subunit
LDGVLETPGRIVVMTCNYPDKLDHALVRPGRVDVTADFKKCLSVTIIEMIEFFYNIDLPENTKFKIMAMNDFMVSPAELGKLMFEDYDNSDKLIKTLLDISAPSA